MPYWESGKAVPGLGIYKDEFTKFETEKHIAVQNSLMRVSYGIQIKLGECKVNMNNGLLCTFFSHQCDKPWICDQMMWFSGEFNNKIKGKMYEKSKIKSTCQRVSSRNVSWRNYLQSDSSFMIRIMARLVHHL